jgi:hypothetical protein
MAESVWPKGRVFAISMGSVTKSEKIGLGGSRNGHGPDAAFNPLCQRFHRLDAGSSLFGNRNRRRELKILAGFMTQNSASCYDVEHFYMEACHAPGR